MVLEVAVVGVGAMGGHHARILSNLPGVHLAAVCDADAQKGETVGKQWGCPSFTSARAMLDHCKLGAAIVAVPTSAHVTVATELLEAGLHVLVEKPIARTSAEGRKLVEVASRHARVLAVGHIERFNPAVSKLRELLQSGSLGSPQSLVSRRVGLPPKGTQDVDVVFDLGVHDFDVMSYLLGRRALHVSATGGSSTPGGRLDHAEILMDFGGVGAFVQVNWLTPTKIRSLSVTGSNATAELNYVTQELRVARRSDQGPHASFGEFVDRYGSPVFEKEPVEVREPLEMELRGFTAAALGKGSDFVDGDAGMEAVRIAEEAVQQIQRHE